MAENGTCRPVTEHVRFRRQGALFRVVSYEVHGLETVKVQMKRSCDDEWQHDRKLGWLE